MYRAIGVALAVIFASLFAIACDPKSGEDSSSLGNEELSGVAFPDTTHGWAVGGGGTILATTDGGKTWSAQRSGSEKPQPTPAH